MMKTFEQYIEQASLDESRQNYIFGGTDDRAPKADKTFGELEEGDVFYYAMYDKRPGRNNELFYIAQYKFGRKEELGNDKTKIFFIKNGEMKSYFTISNKDLDSTLFLGETDLSKQIISTDKDEFFEEVNKATKESWSEKDLSIIE